MSVEDAIKRGGLRMVVVGDVPSPWGEAAKGILHIKGIDWVAVRLAYDSEGQAVDHSGAHAARGRSAGDDHGVDLVEGEQRTEVGLEERRGHALVDDDVVGTIDLAALVELGAARVCLDVLQGVRRIASRAPDPAILA